jgi:putative transposase
MPRVVARDLSHHVTQRGNRRQTTFFNAADYEIYIDQMAPCL